MKRLNLLWVFIVLGMFIVGALESAFADTAVVGPGAAPVIVPPSDNSIYYHIGALNLTVPWEQVNVVYLYDLQGKRNLVGGESVIASLWRLQATVGAVTSLDGHGAPFVGGNLWFENPIPSVAILSQIKPGIFGGFDWQKGAAMFGFKAAFPVFN